MVVKEEVHFGFIGLSHTPTGCSVSRLRGVEFSVSWRGDIARNAKQGTECVERVETAVEVKRELVEIRPRLSGTNHSSRGGLVELSLEALRIHPLVGASAGMFRIYGFCAGLLSPV